MIFFILGCSSYSLPQGFWSLQGIDNDAVGSISIEQNEVYVSIYSEKYKTKERSLAQTEKIEDV